MLTAAAVPFAPIVDLARNTANRVVGLDPNTAEGGATKYTDAAGDAFRRDLDAPGPLTNRFTQGLVSSVTGARPAQAAPPTGRPGPIAALAKPTAAPFQTASAAPSTFQGGVMSVRGNPGAEQEMMANVPSDWVGASGGKPGETRLYSPDAISRLAQRNLMPSTYEADKQKLRGYFMRYLASGDLEGARRTAMTPEDMTLLGAAEAQFQDARAGGPAPNYIQAIANGQNIMAGQQKQQAGGIEMQGKILELAQKRQFNDLYTKYLASTNPAERARLQESILALTGKDKPEEWAALHAAGGNDPFNAMAKLPDSIVALNKRTGQARVLAGGPQDMVAAAKVAIANGADKKAVNARLVQMGYKELQ